MLTYEDNPNLVIPIEFSGVKAMSFGFVAPNKRAIMRGPIVSKIVTSLIKDTDWGELDYLVVDMPPGTGDIQISLCQELNFTGAVVITTPQKLSFIDVVKGIEMFDEMKIPILSVVENMSYFICQGCDKEHHIFGKGFVPMLKDQFGIEVKKFDLSYFLKFSIIDYFYKGKLIKIILGFFPITSRRKNFKSKRFGYTIRLDCS